MLNNLDIVLFEILTIELRYHGGMNRDKANKLLQTHVNTDGWVLIQIQLNIWKCVKYVLASVWN